MSLASVFQRKKTASPRAAGDGTGDALDSLQWERVRARRRLIGAVLLLGLGLVTFPLLFETEPRPLPRDLPIEVARRDAGPVGATPMPAPMVRPAPALPPPDAGNEQPLDTAPAMVASASAAVSTSTKLPSAVVARGSAASAATAAASGSTPGRAARPEIRATAPPSASSSAAAPVARAASSPSGTESRRTATPGVAAASAAGVESAGRFVVQVGAFTDAVALREARQRVEKLGLKTYTQVIETPSGSRTRVRVGPFSTRAEAEQAGAKLKAAGLPAYQLAL